MSIVFGSPAQFAKLEFLVKQTFHDCLLVLSGQKEKTEFEILDFARVTVKRSGTRLVELNCRYVYAHNNIGLMTNNDCRQIALATIEAEAWDLTSQVILSWFFMNDEEHEAFSERLRSELCPDWNDDSFFLEMTE